MNNFKIMNDLNREKNKEKVNRAITEIHRLLNADEQVLVSTLVKRTGLSRSFFYNNSSVKDELVRAQELQNGKSFVAKQQVIFDKAMDAELELLKRKLIEKEQKIESLMRENAQLNKALNIQTAEIIEKL